jgi:Flp pilus assembly protein TadG
MRGFFSLLNRFRADERGVFAVIFGLLAIVLVAMAGAAVDYTSMETARAKAQIALDSAALGLAPKIYDDDVTEEQMIADAQALVAERVSDASVAIDITGADIDGDNGTLGLTGQITVPMAFVQLVGIQSLTATIVSQATKGSIDLEVALAIDITKSMEGEDQIGALETASSALIDIVVKTNQEPTYSKMAIVPWSMGVNVGSYADKVRGTPRGQTNITAASWSTTTGNITNLTRASPGVVTSNNHGLQTGDRIVITGVKGMTQINNPQSGGNKAYRVVKINSNTFSLQQFSNGNAINTTSANGYSTYTSSGSWKKCANINCEVVVTSADHGIEENEQVRITNVQGMTQINTVTTGTMNTSTRTSWTATGVTANTLTLSGTFGPDYGTFSNSGTNYAKLQCLSNSASRRPCQILRYVAADGSTVRMPSITNCVTERATDRYTNTKPSATWLGRHYPDGNSLNNCITNQIVPLTSVKATLHAATTGLVAAGSTSGHTGLAWGWYLLSHSFGADLFPVGSESIPADPTLEDADPVMKVLVLMTDGLFNTSYCDGVVAKNADSVAGNNQQRINCNGVNSTTQGEDLCDAIAADHIIIYTVAFALHEIQDADDRETVRQMLADCATPDGGAFEATDGDDLQEAFRKIGENISDLRLSM